MGYEEAIQVIKNNYPPDRYSMLREALDLAIEVLQKEANGSMAQYEIDHMYNDR